MPVKPPCYTDKLAMLQRCQQTKESCLLQQLPLIFSSIFEKLGVEDRTQAAVLAIRCGLTNLSEP